MNKEDPANSANANSPSQEELPFADVPFISEENAFSTNRLYRRLVDGTFEGPYCMTGQKPAGAYIQGDLVPRDAHIAPPTMGRYKPKPPPKPRKSKDDPATVLAITEVIEAYIKGLAAPPATNQYNHTTNRNAARDIIKAGFSPAQVTACTKDKSADPFWHGKCLPLKTVANDIAAWTLAHKPPPPEEPRRFDPAYPPELGIYIAG